MARANHLHNAVLINESPGKYQLWLDGFEIVGIENIDLEIGAYNSSAEITIKINVNSVNRPMPAEERVIAKDAWVKAEDQSGARVIND